MNLWGWCRLACARVRSVIFDAPWSNFDLVVMAILLGIGGYLLASPTMFDHYGGMYHALTRFGDERVWGGLFLLSGVLAFLTIASPSRPPFFMRLVVRMMAAFCLTSYALNNLSSYPPPVSSVTYSVLSLSAIWAVLRTRHDRR